MSPLEALRHADLAWREINNDLREGKTDRARRRIDGMVKRLGVLEQALKEES